MMYRRNSALHVRTGMLGSIAALCAQGAAGFVAKLDALVKTGLYAAAERENRRRTRAYRRWVRHNSYPYCGKRHRARLARPIAAGQKTAANGVVFA